MKTILMFVTIIVVLSIATLTKSEADFNGNTPVVVVQIAIQHNLVW